MKENPSRIHTGQRSLFVWQPVYTRSTKADLHVELCPPAIRSTRQQKLVDTGGRVERFQRRAAKRAKANAGQE